MNDNLCVIISLIISISVYQSECISDGKGCNFNDAIINRHVYTNNVDWKCYENFAKRTHHLQKVSCGIEHDAQNFTVPGFVIREKCVPFDHRSSSISSLVQSSLSSDTYALWIKCCERAEKCCSQMMNNYSAENFFNTCDGHWDGMNCFRETEPGEIVKMPCPYQIRKNDESKCEYSYSKTCQPNGTWTQSDFTQCHHEARLQNFIEWHLIVLSMTLLLCLPPILSFTLCKSCHGNHFKVLFGLIIFVTLHSVLKLALVSLICTDSMTKNAIICKTLVALTHFTGNMSYVYLSMIPFKLLQIVKNLSFGSWGMFVFMCMGLLLSILSTIFWSFMMMQSSNRLCWLADNEYHWIYDGVRILIILVAIVLLTLGISHQSDKYDKHMMQFSKIFIIPITIFVLPIILNVVSLIFGCCGWEDIQKFTLEFLELLEALVLSIIYFIPLPKSSFKTWSSVKVSSQNSNASLAPSRQSFNRDDNWHDVGIYANNAACYDNDVVYENISTLPEPYKTDNNEIVNYNNHNHHRHTIRQVMLRAKKNLPHVEHIAPKKCSTPPIPLPKIIPNQILDDVQLFDAYYRSLDSACTTSDTNDENESNKKEAQKRISIKNIGKVFMSRSSSQHKSLPDDAASNDIEKFM